VATVNPSVYQALSRDWDFSDYEEGNDDFLSSEGCFACQMNGNSRARKAQKRGRLSRSRRSVTSTDRSALAGAQLTVEGVVVVEPEAGGLANISGPAHGPANYEIELELQPDQTAHRRRIFRIQPATSELVKSVDYSLVRDSSEGQLELKRKSGVWGLFFRRRVEGAQEYSVLIRGRPVKGPSRSDTEVLNALVRIAVRP
jgi:hypothetical protein